MSTIRLIPCLDIGGGRVVKRDGVESLKDAGDPVDVAKFFVAEGAGELMFLDITATSDQPAAIVELVPALAGELDLPFIVGGGLRTLDHIRAALNAGAAKVSINTAAIQDPKIVRETAEEFGSRRIIVAIDVCRRRRSPGQDQAEPPADLPIGLAEGLARGETMLGLESLGSLVSIEEAPDADEPPPPPDDEPPSWEVYTHGGRIPTGMNVVEWATKMAEIGAGEILLTSLDGDGMTTAYDLALITSVASVIPTPVIANVGAGRPDQVVAAIAEGGARAVLLTSLLHDGVYRISDLKARLDSTPNA